MSTIRLFDARNCGLGEGPLWHPLRKQLFWFDIHASTLLSQTASGPLVWSFDEQATAAGWIDHDTLLLATETGLYRYDLETRRKQLVVAIEADRPANRSNDGRADPRGGFWFGTMGKKGETGAGALWRYYRGELRKLVEPMTTPNTICFPPFGDQVYYSDTDVGRIMRQKLDEDGWPSGAPDLFLDLGKNGILPDGAVFDVTGRMWNAQWDIGLLACYSPEGELVHSYELPVRNTTCPAFGGVDLSTVFVTSAWSWRKGADDGKTYAIEVDAVGLPEHRVDLGSG